MIINHNMMSQNSHRMMGINSSTLGKSTEKLSSGLRINRAADDAAGLSISEKMRGQIRGLTQASRNAQDGISVVQTAEGALDEAHSILQRMRELAVQSANDSNVSIDRASIQQEVSALTDELDRIAGTTEFNTQKLLDGTFTNKVFHVGANEDQNIKVGIDSMSATGLGLRESEEDIAKNVTVIGTEIGKLTRSIAKREESIGNLKASIKKITADSISKVQNSINAINTKIGAAIAAGKDVSVAQLKASLAARQVSLAKFEATIAGKQKKIDKLRAGSANSVDVRNKEIDALKAQLAAKGGVLVNTQETANKAITTINDALTKVSKQRSDLGAIQNRMEHTIKNLDNAAENLQAAESRIRDVDMAKEMSEFTKKNILTQASQAMLAQANQLPQQVLQLLR